LRACWVTQRLTPSLGRFDRYLLLQGWPMLLATA